MFDRQSEQTLWKLDFEDIEFRIKGREKNESSQVRTYSDIVNCGTNNLLTPLMHDDSLSEYIYFVHGIQY